MNDLGSTPAQAAGQAQRISSADNLEQMASDLKAKGGTLTAQVTVTRAGTGQVEHHTLTFSAAPDQ